MLVLVGHLACSGLLVPVFHRTLTGTGPELTRTKTPSPKPRAVGAIDLSSPYFQRFTLSSLCINTYFFSSRAFIIVAMAASHAVLAQGVTQKKPEGLDLYSRFALAGALGCSVTHGAFTPVDVYDILSVSALLPLTNTPAASRPRSSLTPLPITVV